MNTDIELSYIMPVFFNQENTKVLIDLLTTYASYDDKIVSKIQFILVDDASPIAIEIPSNVKINYHLLRITDDIEWNQGGARNLGIVYAKSDKVIVADCDHVFPEDLLRSILRSKTPHRTLYEFKRVDYEGRKESAHQNIFYTSKAVMFSALAYDEEFSGNYGHEDVMFKALNRRINNKIRYFTRWKKIISSGIDRDDSYHTLERDSTVNKKLLAKKLELLKGNDPFSSHSRVFLNFNYQKVKESWI